MGAPQPCRARRPTRQIPTTRGRRDSPTPIPGDQRAIVAHPRTGRMAVQVYYTLSPPIADVIARSATLRAMVRVTLLPLLGWAGLALWSPALGVGVPLLPLVVGVWRIGRRSRRG